MSYVKIGVAGPVGSGSLPDQMSYRQMASEYSRCLSPISLKEDAGIPEQKLCSSTQADHRRRDRRLPTFTIREDASMNLEAVERDDGKIP